MKKYKTLEKFLKSEGKKNTDIIKWAYYGYGFLSCQGECQIKDLNPNVKFAKCFMVDDFGVYCVDGAL